MLIKGYQQNTESRKPPCLVIGFTWCGPDLRQRPGIRQAHGEAWPTIQRFTVRSDPARCLTVTCKLRQLN